MGTDGDPYDPDFNVYHHHVNPSQPEPLPYSTPPPPRSPPPVWPVPVFSDYPDFYSQPIDENDRSYVDFLNPAIFDPDSTDESCNGGNAVNSDNNGTNNNAGPVVRCNIQNNVRDRNGVIRGDDMIVGVNDRNDLIDVIDVDDDEPEQGNDNNIYNVGTEEEEEEEEEKLVFTKEMVDELLGIDVDAWVPCREKNNNVDRKDKGKAVVVEPEPDANVGNVIVEERGRGDAGPSGETAGTSAGPSGTGRTRFHWVPLGSLDCNSCHVSSGLYVTDDPRFGARITIHGLNGMYHHIIFEIQNADPALAQEVQMFIFDMYGLPLERINADLAYYNVQITPDGQIELHETFLNIYTRITGREFLPPLHTVMGNTGGYEQINYDFNQDFMMVGGEDNGVQPTTYEVAVAAPTPLAIEMAPQPSMINTTPHPLILEMPPPSYNNHNQHQHHYNHDAMPHYPNAFSQGVRGYLPAPNQFAVEPLRINRPREIDPLRFLDREIPDWMRGASSPEPEEDDYFIPRPTVGIQRERTANMSPLDLAPYFHIKADQASNKLKVCSTTLKILCRRKGLKRWPYRKIRSMDNKIIGQRRMLKECIVRGDRIGVMNARKEIQKLRERRIEFYRSILKKMMEHPEENKENDNNR